MLIWIIKAAQPSLSTTRYTFKTSYSLIYMHSRTNP